MNAVLNNFVGDTGIFLQNLGSALSISFLRFSAFKSLLIVLLPDVDDDDDVECFWNNIKIARATL